MMKNRKLDLLQFVERKNIQFLSEDFGLVPKRYL